MPKASTRTKRIEARITPDAFILVKRAAEIQGRSVSDFVVEAAQGAAQDAIKKSQVISLSLEDQQRFVDLLLDPPEPTEALHQAYKAHQTIITEA